MSSPHPLDRVVWSALSGRQRDKALGDDSALRMNPTYGFLTAPADPTDTAALARLPIDGQGLIFLEPAPFPVPAGLVETSQSWGVQMIAETVPSLAAPSALIELGDADAPEMLELALLTRPGPFASATHRLGRFIGLREHGRLIAMAGGRLQPTGFTEVSGVCTHPAARGRGLARTLSAIVASRIIDRGETPFLHAYEANHAAIGLYEALGFRIRQRVVIQHLMRG